MSPQDWLLVASLVCGAILGGTALACWLAGGDRYVERDVKPQDRQHF